jgi:hypothetical protein
MGIAEQWVAQTSLSGLRLNRFKDRRPQNGVCATRTRSASNHGEFKDTFAAREETRVPNPNPGVVGSLSSRLRRRKPVTFEHGHELVGVHALDRLHLPVRPADLDFVRLARWPQAEVLAQVAL